MYTMYEELVRERLRTLHETAEQERLAAQLRRTRGRKRVPERLGRWRVRRKSLPAQRA